jgi:hypothetical protein
LNGKTYPDTELVVGSFFVLPKGKYIISIDKPLKGESDNVYLQEKNACGEEPFSIEISTIPKEIEIPTQTICNLVFSFADSTNYIFGDNYSEQEDFGKDYSIKINVISGGVYERKRYRTMIRGDANGDGKISVEDLIYHRILELGGMVEIEDDYLFRMDTNGDGTIDDYDLIAIKMDIIGSEIAIRDIEFVEVEE